MILSHFDVVEPDLLYLSNERAADVLHGHHVGQGAPDLVIEIGSPGTRKRDEPAASPALSRSKGASRFAARKNGPSADVLTVTAPARAIRAPVKHRFGNETE